MRTGADKQMWASASIQCFSYAWNVPSETEMLFTVEDGRIQKTNKQTNKKQKYKYAIKMHVK